MLWEDCIPEVAQLAYLSDGLFLLGLCSGGKVMAMPVAVPQLPQFPPLFEDERYEVGCPCEACGLCSNPVGADQMGMLVVLPLAGESASEEVLPPDCLLVCC